MSIQTTEELELREVQLSIPLKDEELQQLRIGDVVYLNGLIFTGRVRFYQWVLEEGHIPPIDIKNRCNVNFHCSPAVGEVAPGEYRITSVTATASFRFAKWIAPLFEEYGVKAIIGKAGMQEEVYESVFKKYGAIYLSTVGYGLGARYGQSVTKVSDVFWKEELGLAQAMWVLDVKHFGPLLVDCDTEGNSLQAIAKKEVDKVFSPLRDSYPLPTLKRHGEISAFTEDII